MNGIGAAMAAATAVHAESPLVAQPKVQQARTRSAMDRLNLEQLQQLMRELGWYDYDLPTEAFYERLALWNAEHAADPEDPETA